jgi:sterol 3beta-glucosyltransferase
VRLPYLGAQEKGVLGFSKGIAKGVGGLVFKPGAAVFGVPGYTLKGIEKQLEKRHDRPLKARLLVVRMKQGIVGLDKGNEEEKSLVVKRWKELVLGREYEVVASCIRGEGVEECVEHLSEHV